MRHKISHLSIPLLLVMAVMSILACGQQGSDAPTTTQPGVVLVQPVIVMGECKIVVDHIGVDALKLDLDKTSIALTNQGREQVTIGKLTLSVGNETIEHIVSYSLDPGKTEDYYFLDYWTSGELPKTVGVNEVTCTITAFDPLGKILAAKEVSIPIPVVQIGDAIQEFATEASKNNLELTLISWAESTIAVEGPYSGNEYYAFTAKPGMKFINLVFEMKNNWTRVQETPYLNAGEIATDKGYIYGVWDSPLGMHSEEYGPRVATAKEIQTLLGDAAAYENLLQEQSVQGRVVFEIPTGETPIEASIAYIPSLVRFNRSQ